MLRRGGKNTQKNYTKKYFNDPDNHICISDWRNTNTYKYDGVITHLEPHILECEVKWAVGSITMNKASGGDGIPAELFQILKDDAVKVLHSICQQIWKTHQCPQSVGIGQFSFQPQRRAMPKHQFFGAQPSFGQGNSNPLQYSCLGNPMDGGAW